MAVAIPGACGDAPTVYSQPYKQRASPLMAGALSGRCPACRPAKRPC